MGSLVNVKPTYSGGRKDNFIYVYSNVDEIIKEFKGRISNSVLQAAKTLTEGFRDEIQNTYSFRNISTVDDYVQMRFHPGANLAHVRVIGKKFTAGRMNFRPPGRNQPGWTDIRYMRNRFTGFKGFPLRFENGGIMATRSGVTNIIEPSWQERQSAMPFTPASDFDEIMDRTKETVFQTTVTRRLKSGKQYSYKRKHSFRIVKTKNIVEIAERIAPELISQISKDVNIEITRPKTEFWKFKKKRRRG